MKKALYSIAAKALSSFLPDAWVNKDTVGAVLGFISVALLLAFGWRAIPWLVRFFF